MRVPISWLREFVDVPEGATADDILAALVAVGFEEEDVHRFEVTGPVVVGQVLEFTPEPQTNGKTINWCSVDVGEAEPRGIVCGAHNFVVGDKVVVTLPGAVLPGPFPIAARKTYGHTSDGMIASARELGLGEEHAGILLLKSLGLDAGVGTDAIALLGLDDFAVEINVTPDRGYAFSIRGVAREYSNSTGAEFRDPAEAPGLQAYAWDSSQPDSFVVSIDDGAPVRGRVGAFAFTTRVVRNVDATRPTPAWMVSRLTLAGIRSISLLVDITNYVMWELGQPIHGYDFDKVAGGLTVRRAATGETLVTLDGQSRKLDPQDLVIADDSGPIGLAGVMGGAATEITSQTKNVLVEAGNFDPTSIARTARRHKLPSEASKRYERGVDPRVTEPASARVVQLLVELAGGTVDPLGSSYLDFAAPTPIELPDGHAERLMGVAYTDAEVDAALVAIGSSVEAGVGSLLVTPPTWRPDLTDRETLVEEVARIVGYERIPSILPVAPPGRGLTRSQRSRRTVSEALAAAGLTEVQSYPFLAKASNDRFGSPVAGDVPAMKLVNPLDAQTPWMRTSLLPGLLEIARRNLGRGLVDLALFEVGVVFRPEPGVKYGSGPLPVGNAHPGVDVLAELNASIPPQPRLVSALFLGDSIEKQPGLASVASGIADALAVVQEVALVLGDDVTIRTGSHQSLHPGRTAEVFIGGRSVGFAGELLPSLADELDLPRVVGLVELDLDALIELGADDIQAVPIETMPAATQDLSLVVAVDVPAGDVLTTVIEGAGELLEHATLVDDYRGTGVDDGQKSLTFALRFRAPDRTLTAAEASAAKDAAAASAAHKHGAVTRA
jgi:phenylalanyl-tRNA synthetase beta chain